MADYVLSELKELRESEKEIQKRLDVGIHYAAGKVNVIASWKRYISLKQGVRYNTKVGKNEMRWTMKKYRKLHPGKPLPNITPHVFRHTFSTPPLSEMEATQQ